MKTKWIFAVVLGILGAGYSFRGIAGMAEGKRWAMLGRGHAGPMSPAVTTFVGLIFVVGAIYVATRKIKSDRGK